MSELENPILPVPFPERHSQEVQEIISRPPDWIVRWGTTLIFVLITAIFTACWFIKYPDIISANFILTANDAPRIVVARSEGKLQRLIVRDGQLVRRGQILAFGESTAKHDRVLSLDKDIAEFNNFIQQNQWSKIDKLQISNYDQLGEIQNDFQKFTEELAETKTFLAGGFYQQKRKLLLDDMRDLQDMEGNLVEQLELRKLDFDLGKEEFSIQEKLIANKVISPLEYKREKSKLLAREMPVKDLLSYKIQNRSSQTEKRKEILELDNGIIQRKSRFQQALQSLRSSIDTWKQQYIFTAPIGGKISFAFPWQEEQHIVAGQEFLTIEPSESNFRGLITIRQTNLGKLKEGQKVLIKLEGYPYREYGMLEGVLSKLSSTPGRDSLYWGYVELPNQLKTRYGRTLLYRNGLKGTAEIITSDRRLIERFVNDIYSVESYIK